MSRFDDVYRRSLDDPEAFWAEAAAEIDWETPWQRVLDDSRAPFYRWFAGGELNTCHNALDRHVEGSRADQLALIYDSPLTETKATFTYRELRDAVARFAGALTARGVERGDRVVIYMPMVPEAVIAMLACARIGAIHSVVFGGFAANELASRIEDAKPKVIVSASCGIEPGRVVEYKPLLDAAIELVESKPEHSIVLQRPMCEAVLDPSWDVEWNEALTGIEPAACVSVEATDPLYILYTSGTTGQPKGIVRDNGGHAVALAWSMKSIYDVDPGEVYWAASDIGWTLGHRYDLSRFRALFLAGERCDPETLRWAEERLGVPVVDHYWQTETGWPVVANCMGIERLPVVPESPTKPVPGWDVRVVDESGKELGPGDIGPLVVKLPLPPGSSPTLWNADDRFRETYLSRFPGYYESADAGYLDENGYVFVMARTDDIINVAGHRLSTRAIEEVLAAHPDVAECAVVGVADELKGQIPIGLLVLKAGVEREHEGI